MAPDNDRSSYQLAELAMNIISTSSSPGLDPVTYWVLQCCYEPYGRFRRICCRGWDDFLLLIDIDNVGRSRKTDQLLSPAYLITNNT